MTLRSVGSLTDVRRQLRRQARSHARHRKHARRHLVLARRVLRRQASSRLATLSTVLAVGVAALGTATVVLIAFAVGTARLRLLPDLSGNLAPDITAGSLVVLHPVPMDSLSTEDVIALPSTRTGGVTALGRIVSKGRSDGLVRVATAGGLGAGPVAVQLRGPSVTSVWFTVPRVGYVATWFHSPTGEGVVAGALVLLLVALAHLRRWGARGRRRRRQGAPASTGVAAGPEP